MPTGRREFLKWSAGTLAGCFVFRAGGLSDALQASQSLDRRAFPLGVASGDPQHDAVLLWTRIAPAAVGDREAGLTVQVSPAPSFERVLLQRTLTARADNDFTVRILVTDLRPDTMYYYRFVAADGAVSRTGRTWTAPPVDARRPVNIAFVSCQSYPPNRYGAYRRLLIDERAGPDGGIAFILHLGDFVYDLPVEGGRGREGGRGAAPGDGGGRGRGAAPPGGDSFGAALTEYRRIYRGYLADPDLQDARAAFPFVCVWDDHEFMNDSWQGYGSRAAQARRLAANQAWFEFVPQILTGAWSIGGVKNEARDYVRPAREVVNTALRDFDEHFLSRESNNLAAIESLTIYRSLRWGATVDLILTDTRAYRSPSASPSVTVENIEDGTAPAGTGGVIDRFEVYSEEYLAVLAEGRAANKGRPPRTVTINGRELPNVRAGAPPVTMLGARQKLWFKESLRRSRAVWRVWANPDPLMRFRFDLSAVDPGQTDGILWTDSWDGYPNEREELMRFVREERIANVVSLTGDRHAHYAGLVAENYLASEPRYVVPEFACTSISSQARTGIVANQMRRDAEHLAHLNRYTRPAPGGGNHEMPNLNVTMRAGARAADVMARTGDAAQAARAATGANPHLEYADNDAHGYAIARFTGTALNVEFVTVPSVDATHGPDGPPIRRVVGFQVPAWAGGQPPRLVRTLTRGEPVFGEW